MMTMTMPLIVYGWRLFSSTLNPSQAYKIIPSNAKSKPPAITAFQKDELVLKITPFQTV